MKAAPAPFALARCAGTAGPAGRIRLAMLAQELEKLSEAHALIEDGATRTLPATRRKNAGSR